MKDDEGPEVEVRGIDDTIITAHEHDDPVFARLIAASDYPAFARWLTDELGHLEDGGPSDIFKALHTYFMAQIKTTIQMYEAVFEPAGGKINKDALLLALNTSTSQFFDRPDLQDGKGVKLVGKENGRETH